MMVVYSAALSEQNLVGKSVRMWADQSAVERVASLVV